jgi:hypothetical protein
MFGKNMQRPCPFSQSIFLFHWNFKDSMETHSWSLVWDLRLKEDLERKCGGSHWRDVCNRNQIVTSRCRKSNPDMGSGSKHLYSIIIHVTGTKQNVNCLALSLSPGSQEQTSNSASHLENAWTLLNFFYSTCQTRICSCHWRYWTLQYWQSFFWQVEEDWAFEPYVRSDSPHSNWTHVNENIYYCFSDHYLESLLGIKTRSILFSLLWFGFSFSRGAVLSMWVGSAPLSRGPVALSFLSQKKWLSSKIRPQETASQTVLILYRPALKDFRTEMKSREWRVKGRGLGWWSPWLLVRGRGSWPRRLLFERFRKVHHVLQYTNLISTWQEREKSTGSLDRFFRTSKIGMWLLRFWLRLPTRTWIPCNTTACKPLLNRHPCYSMQKSRIYPCRVPFLVIIWGWSLSQVRDMSWHALALLSRLSPAPAARWYRVHTCR